MEVSPYVLKECAVALASPHSILFLRSLKERLVSKMYIYVNLAYKKSDLEFMLNNRPVSPISMVSKTQA